MLENQFTITKHWSSKAMPPPTTAEFSMKCTVPLTSTLDCIRDIPPPSFLLNTLVPLRDMGNLKLTITLCSFLLPKKVLISDQDIYYIALFCIIIVWNLISCTHQSVKLVVATIWLMNELEIRWTALPPFADVLFVNVMPVKRATLVTDLAPSGTKASWNFLMSQKLPVVHII